MDPRIIAAIITGASTLAAAVLTLMFSTQYRFLVALSSSRRKALRGAWCGVAEQKSGRRELRDHFEVTFDLKVRWFKVVKGQATYSTDSAATVVKLRGGFLSERFLKLDYWNPHRQEIHFGVVILELDASARTLSGRFLGYGRESQDLIGGTVELHKA